LKKREIVLSIIIVAMFILVTFCIVKTSNVGRRLSELEVERQRSCSMLMPATCVLIVPLKANEVNFTNAGIRQDQLQVNNRLEFSPDSENIATPEVCASQWLQDVFTVEETLDCIEDYVKNAQFKMQGQEP